MTPLHCAAEHNLLDVATLLIEKGAHIEALSKVSRLHFVHSALHALHLLQICKYTEHILS